jgi:flagellar biosynthesis/type III secretory pathway protein FliH
LTTPLDTWLYFLRSAEGLDPEALPGPLDTPEIRQAVEALTMLTRVDIQKEIYEGRIRARRDERMRWIDALAEGRAEGRAEGLAQGWEKGRAEGLAQGWEKGRTEGRAEGLLIGRIEFAQQLLRREATPRADLDAMPLEALEALAAQLEQELGATRPGG